MQGTFFYKPGDLGYEQEVKRRMEANRMRDEEEHLSRRVQRYAREDEDFS
jgi:hypothetical protein